MPDCLHPLLLLLTLLDLGFVQATDVVSFTGLLPLWLLAAVWVAVLYLRTFAPGYRPSELQPSELTGMVLSLYGG